MKLAFASSPSHDVLKNHIFLGTLCDPWELVEFRFEFAGDGNFKSPSFNRIIAERNIRLLNLIKANMGEVLVSADVDIQWFRPSQEALIDELADRDVAFQRELPNSDVANCGLVVIRCNERSAALYEQVVGATRQGRDEQEFINELIAHGRMPCTFAILSSVFFNDNLDGRNAPSDDQLLLYHSVGTFPAAGKSSTQIKLERHLEMRARMLRSEGVLRPIPGIGDSASRPVTVPPSQRGHRDGSVRRLSQTTRRESQKAHPPVGSHELSTRNRVRCRNLIVHPNGQLYGDVSGLGCRRWRAEDGHLMFFDTPDRVRFLFEKGADGNWRYQAPVNRFDAEWSRHGMIRLRDGQDYPVKTPSVDYELTPGPPLPDKTRFEIVLAKYMEDIAWADCYLANMTIYSKGGTDERVHIRLPNLGREGGSYLFHIAQNYDRLADRTLFLQGDPFPHPVLAINNYAAGGGFIAAHSGEQSMAWTVPWSAPSQQIDRAVMEDFLRLIECDPAITSFRWTQGAQFSVSRAQIHRRPRNYYEKLLNITQQPTVELAGRPFDNHHVAWLFELFWRYVFSAGNEP